MRKGFRILTAAVLSADLALTAALPLWAADTQSKSAPQSGETEIASLFGGIESSNAGDIAGKVKDQLGKATAGTIKVQLGDLFYQLLESSGESDGTDMSWLKSVSLDGTCVGSDEGYDASGTVSVNDSPFYDVQVSFDPQQGLLYMNVPEIKDQPFYYNISEMMNEAMAQDSGDGSTVGQQFSQSAELFSRLAEEGQEAFGSVTDQEWNDFFTRYGNLIAAGITAGQQSQTTITAGSLQTDASLQSVSIQPQDMDKILQSGAAELAQDPVVAKILSSDFVTDILTLAQSSGSGTTGEQSLPATGEELLAEFQQFITENLSQIQGAPGFTFTYGTDADGKLVSLQLDLIYSGAQMTLFTANMINNGNQNAYDFQLGEFLATVLAQSTDTSADGSTEETSAAPAGPTGLLLEGTTASGILNETITLQNAGQTIFTADIKDWDINKMKQGSVNGSVTVDVQGTPFTVQFSSEANNNQTIDLLVSDSLLAGVTIEAHDGNPADVKKLDRAGAVQFKSEEDMENYLQDIDVDQLRDSLKEKMTAAGFPQEIIDGQNGEEATQDTATTAA